MFISLHYPLRSSWAARESSFSIQHSCFSCAFLLPDRFFKRCSRGRIGNKPKRGFGVVILYRICVKPCERIYILIYLFARETGMGKYSAILFFNRQNRYLSIRWDAARHSRNVKTSFSLGFSLAFHYLCTDPVSPAMGSGIYFIGKGRLRTLSSTVESRKFELSSKIRQRERSRWMYCHCR